MNIKQTENKILKLFQDVGVVNVKYDGKKSLKLTVKLNLKISKINFEFSLPKAWVDDDRMDFVLEHKEEIGQSIEKMIISSWLKKTTILIKKGKKEKRYIFTPMIGEKIAMHSPAEYIETIIKDFAGGWTKEEEK